MQLKLLYIEDHKILKDFTYEFPYDFKHYSNVIIGANGSGKSTILECLAEIFSITKRNKKSKFGFELEYSLRHEKTLSESPVWSEFKTDHIVISITAKKGQRPHIGTNMPDGSFFSLSSLDEIQHAQTLKSINPHIRPYALVLPENVVIYYSGLSEIMKDISLPHRENFSEKSRKGQPDNPLFMYYHEPKLFDIILLSLLSYEYGDIPEYLSEKAKIQELQSIRIVLKKPKWAVGKAENFWGAKGDVGNFLRYLDEQSASIEQLENPELSKGKGNLVIETFQNESVIITVIGQERLFSLREYLGEEKKLFKIFYAMYVDGLLDDITFAFKNTKGEHFATLSEGEEQCLTVRGLAELLSNRNTLFLFDEPDTYLHPKWQQSFIAEIESVAEEQNFQNEISFVTATHSPQILANAKPENTFVKIIENGKLVDKTPKHYGREISSILYNLMGVNERNEQIKKDLDKLFILIEEEELPEAEEELGRLSEILGETDADIQNARIQINFLKEDEADS